MIRWEFYPPYWKFRAHYMAVVGGWFLVARQCKNGWRAIVDFGDKRLFSQTYATAEQAQAAAILALEKICKPVAPIMADLDGHRGIGEWIGYPADEEISAQLGMIDTKEGMKFVRASSIQAACADGVIAAAQGAGADSSASVPALHEVAG